MLFENVFNMDVSSSQSPSKGRGGLCGSVIKCRSGNPGVPQFESHWIHWAFHGNDLVQDTLEP